MKVNVALDGSEPEEVNFEYVHEQYHNGPVCGMDICLRKQLIVTASDEYIKIWNYHTKTEEIKHKVPSGEEVSAVAFHPSGFHIVVALANTVVIMNVLSNSIKEFIPLQVKGCKEI